MAEFVESRWRAWERSFLYIPGYSVCVALELPWRASGWLSLREYGFPVGLSLRVYGFPVGTWFHWVIDGRTFYTLGELQVLGLMCLTCWC